MIRALFLLIVSFISITTFGQKPFKYAGRGIQMTEMWADSVARIPSDTVRNKTGIARIGVRFFVGNGTFWTEIAGGSGTSVDTTGKFVNSVTMPNDSTIIVCKGTECTSYTVRGGTASPVDTTGKFVNSVTFPTDSTAIVCKAGVCTQYSIKGGAGGSGGSTIDTTGAFVNSVVSTTDSTITVCKGGTCITYVIGQDIYAVSPISVIDSTDGKKYLTIDTTGFGGGGSGASQNLDQVAAIDSALTHTILAISPFGDTTSIRDSIAFKKNFSNNTANLGVKGALTAVYRDEKTGTLDPAGKYYGKINNWLWTNNYNGGPSTTHRRGFGQTLMGYNFNNAGGRENSGDAAFGMILETDFQRKLEWYLQTENTNGLSYRPIFVVAYKDTAFASVELKSNYVQNTLTDTAAAYFKAENGKVTISQIPNRTAPSPSNTLLTLIRSGREITFGNNGSNGAFTGAATSYSFDKSIVPAVTATSNIGGNTQRYQYVFSNTLVSNYKAVADANYTQVDGDGVINFKNITANRTFTPILGSGAGQYLTLVMGQSSYKITFAGSVNVKNIDGTTATEVPIGKAVTMVWDNTTFFYQIVTIN